MIERKERTERKRERTERKDKDRIENREGTERIEG